LGLTLLALGNGTSLENVYGKKGAFDNQKLDQHVQAFEKRYKDRNPRMVQLLYNLVEVDVEKRENAQTILHNVEKA